MRLNLQRNNEDRYALSCRERGGGLVQPPVTVLVLFARATEAWIVAPKFRPLVHDRLVTFAISSNLSFLASQAVHICMFVGDILRLRDWLHGLTESTAIAGASGPIRFRRDGDPVDKGIVLTRARRGRLIVEKSQ